MILPLLDPDGGKRGVTQERISSSAHHILKDRYAETVTFIIKDLRLDLDVLAQSVKAHPLCRENILGEASGRGGGVDPVAVISLIEKPFEEIGLTVKRQSRNAVHRGDRDLAERKVGIHVILPRFYRKSV